MIILIILIILVLLSFNLFRNLFKNDVTILDDVKLKESEPSNNGFALMLEQDDGTYEQSNSSTWPSGMVFNSELSGCLDINGNKIDNSLSFDTTNNLVNVSVGETAYCYLYFDKDSRVYAKVVDDYLNGNGVSKLSDSDKGNRDYDTYYYTGNITNNNVLYADHCWEMVITTEGEGVKMIYKGIPYYVYSSINKISESEYNVSTNTPSAYPFTYDSNTNEWTSGIAGQNSTTNTIEFTVATAGDYALSYSVSSESNYDKASFYKNGTALESDISGTVDKTIDLSGLTTSDVIKVTYTKDGSSSSGSDTVTFSIGKPTGEKILSCDNTGDASTIGESKFNSKSSSLAYVGYMYNKAYTATSKSMSSDTTEYVYGNTFTYENGTYTLVDTMSGAWSSVENSLNNNHYTCFNTSGTCTSLYYIYTKSASHSHDPYYITLTYGKSVEDALNEMLYAEDVNTKDSTIKAYIDNWFENNLLNTKDSEGNKYSSYLQNTIYCANRAATSLGGWNPNGGSISNEIRFNYNTLDCANKNDQFTLSVDNGGIEGYGNNALTYPIALISYKEASLAMGSSSTTSYLFNNFCYWLLSPLGNFYSVPLVNFVRSLVYDSAPSYANANNGVRPTITLDSNVEITLGNGSYTNPYQVKLNNE